MGIFDKIKSARDDDSAMRAREHVKRCEQLQHAGRIHEALLEAEQAVRLDPNNADGQYGLGQCNHAIARAENERAGGGIYFRAGLPPIEQAITAFQKVVALQPTAADGFLSLGLACDNACRLDEAEEHYMEAIRLDPIGLDGLDARSNLALLLHMQAIGWAGHKQFPASFRLSVGDPRLARSFKLAEEGIRLSEQRIQGDPSYLPDLVKRHRATAGWYDRVGWEERALVHYQAILRHSPGDAQAIERLQAAERERVDDELYLRATPLDRAQRWLLSVDPSTLGMFSNTNTLIEDGNLLIEIVFSPQDIEWARRVNEFAVKALEAGSADQYKEAIELYKSALKMAPGCDLYLMSIGSCYANMGNLHRGLRYLERAAEISPGHEGIQQNLAAVRQAVTVAQPSETPPRQTSATEAAAEPAETQPHLTLSRAPLDGRELSMSAIDAFQRAASGLRLDEPMDTRRLFNAIEDSDMRSEWDRLWLHAGEPSFRASLSLADPEPDSYGNWGNVPLTCTCTRSLQVAVLLCDAYNLWPMPVGAIALGLIANPESGASQALMFAGDLDHPAVISMLQDITFGARFNGIERLLATAIQPRDDGGTA